MGFRNFPNATVSTEMVLLEKASQFLSHFQTSEMQGIINDLDDGVPWANRFGWPIRDLAD